MSAPARHSRPAVFFLPLAPDVSALTPFDEWTLDAACRGMVDKDENEDDQWHPNSRQDVSLGKQFCKSCPVREECLQWALAYDIKDGTWGGKDQWERKELKKRSLSQPE